MRVFPGPTYLSEKDLLKSKVVAWPLTADPATAGEAAIVPQTRCLVLTGSDLEASEGLALGKALPLGMCLLNPLCHLRLDLGRHRR